MVENLTLDEEVNLSDPSTSSNFWRVLVDDSGGSDPSRKSVMSDKPPTFLIDKKLVRLRESVEIRSFSF